MSKKYFERLARGTGVSKKEFSSDFGLKILKKFGWEEGKGLGENLEGRQDCVQITRREERVGLGGEKVEAQAEDAWDNWWSDAYNSVAKKTNGKNETNSKNKPQGTIEDASSSSSSSDDDDSDNENPNNRTSAIKSARVMRGKLARICRQEQRDNNKAVIGKDDKNNEGEDDDKNIPTWLVQTRKFRKKMIKRLEQRLKKLAEDNIVANKAEGTTKSSKNKRKTNDTDETTSALEENIIVGAPSPKKVKKASKMKETTSIDIVVENKNADECSMSKDEKTKKKKKKNKE